MQVPLVDQQRRGQVIKNSSACVCLLCHFVGILQSRLLNASESLLDKSEDMNNLLCVLMHYQAKGTTILTQLQGSSISLQDVLFYTLALCVPLVFITYPSDVRLLLLAGVLACWGIERAVLQHVFMLFGAFQHHHHPGNEGAVLSGTLGSSTWGGVSDVKVAVRLLVLGGMVGVVVWLLLKRRAAHNRKEAIFQAIQLSVSTDLRSAALTWRQWHTAHTLSAAPLLSGAGCFRSHFHVACGASSATQLTLKLLAVLTSASVVTCFWCDLSLAAATRPASPAHSCRCLPPTTSSSSTRRACTGTAHAQHTAHSCRTFQRRPCSCQEQCSGSCSSPAAKPASWGAAACSWWPTAACAAGNTCTQPQRFAAGSVWLRPTPAARPCCA